MTSNSPSQRERRRSYRMHAGPRTFAPVGGQPTTEQPLEDCEDVFGGEAIDCSQSALVLESDAHRELRQRHERERVV